MIQFYFVERIDISNACEANYLLIQFIIIKKVNTCRFTLTIDCRIEFLYNNSFDAIISWPTE